MHRDRRVAFLARDLVWEDRSGGTLPFSYAARKLDASIRSASDLGDVATTTIDLRETEPEAYFEQIRAFRPTVIAASTYIWSIDLFCRVAEMVHRWDPEVRFVMGGPAARPSVLSLAPYAPYAPYVDAVVKGEGEEIIRRIARHHLDDDWREKVPGLHVRHALGWRHSGDIERPILDDYASPYQLGTVPRAAHGFLETFRGCPIGCAFCQWGEARADRVYSAEYLAEHLRGFEAAGVESVHVLDAALNLSGRAFRNIVLAEREVGVLRDRQVHGHIYPTHITEEHLSFFDALGRPELAVGVQSFDGEMLEGLGRPFDAKRFEHVLEELSGRYPIHLELILGLPGDDAASFRRTFERAMGINATVRVFHCLALPDALLDRAEEFDLDFDPLTFEVRSCRGWSAESLSAEWKHVRDVAGTMLRPNLGSNWVDFRTEEAELHREGAAASSRIATATVERLRGAVADAKMGFRLTHARIDGARLIMSLDGAAGPVILEATTARAGTAHFAEHAGISYSHRGELAQGEAEKLRSFIERVHRDVRLVAQPLAASAGAAAGQGV